MIKKYKEFITEKLITEHFRDYEGETKECECVGDMVWCDTCEMYSKTCCEEYGSCACS